MNPQERILAYLAKNKSRIERSTLAAVIADVKLSVFYGMSPLKDEEIREIIAKWAMIHAVGLLITPLPPSGPAPGKAPSNSESDFVAAVKRAISTVGAGVTVGGDDANINIGVSGATLNLKQPGGGMSVGLSWTGTLKAEANAGNFYFTETLSKDKWEISLSFPRDTYIPDMSKLEKVFSEGEKGLVAMAGATRTFTDTADVRKVAALVKPHTDNIQNAVEAVTGIAKAKPGPSFGFKLGSPDPPPGQEGMQGGWQATVVFSWVF